MDDVARSIWQALLWRKGLSRLSAAAAATAAARHPCTLDAAA